MGESVTIYGASDDLIELDGAIYEEFNAYGTADDDDGGYLAFSDGTLLEIRYTQSGIWRIHMLVEGGCRWAKHEATDDDTDYTDRVTLTPRAGDAPLTWAVFGTARAKAKAHASTDAA